MKKKNKRKYNMNEVIASYIFIAPMVAGLLIFYVFAFFQNIYFSFHNVGAFGSPEFIGIANYQRLFSDPKFYLALKNTLFYTIVGVPAVVIISLVLAVLLNQDIKGRTLYRTAIFIPSITMPAAIGLLMSWIFNYRYGIFNHLLSKIGVDPIAWLGSHKTVRWTILIVLVWSMISQQTIIMLAGLQGISKEYYEAADIDGANKVQQFFKITIPLLSPTTFFISVMSTIGILQIFDFIFLMVDRGSVAYNYAMSLVSYFYDLAFAQNVRGYASAITVVLFGLVLVVTIGQFILQKKFVHYD